MNNERPLILVSNDDGITAPGIRNLAHIMKEFGEVIVVAPDSPSIRTRARNYYWRAIKD